MIYRLEDLNPSRIQYLLECLDDDAEIERMAQASYVHANGFCKIPLGKDERGTALRLHHWRAEQEIEENVHNHRWDLVSRILHGRMVEKRWRVQPDRIGDWDLFTSSPRTEEGQQLVVRTNERIAAKLYHTREFFKGEAYECRQGEFHQTALVGMPTATLTACLTTAPKVEFAQVVYPHGQWPEEGAKDAPGLTKREFEARIEEILELL